MKSDVLLQIVEGKYLNRGKENRIKNIVIDSREVKKNDVFIALIGKNFDGHNYIKEVLKKKPSCIIVCKQINIKTNVPIILVEDTYDSLIKIGIFFRNKYDIPVIAITGSVGKTTTKEIISTILSKKYRVLKSEKNHNNHIGLPLTLMRLNHSYDVCVLEMGMNHLGEISKLSKMCRPNISVITNIGTAHIGNLGSKANILKAKMEIVDGMEEGLLIVNSQDKMLKKVKYPNIIKCNKKLRPYSVIAEDKVTFKLVINNEVHKFCFNSSNRKLITNFILAIQVGLLFKVDIDDIKAAISEYQMPKERMSVFFNNTTKIIDDCYNASLESVIASLDVLRKAKGHKILILGDILELGDYSDKIHKQIGKHLKKISNIDVLLIGKAVKNIKGKNYKYFDNNRELIGCLNKLSKDKTTILIKGSRKMGLEEVVESLKNNS